MKLILDYSDETKTKRINKKLFETIFRCVIERMKVKSEIVEVSLTFVDEDRIHELNKQYRDIDRSTDVLTFAYQENNSEISPVLDLGSIIICKDIAKRQAKEYSHPYLRELAFLFIHGLLHSLGYDHMKDDEKEVMFALQNEILNSLPIDFYTDISKVKRDLYKAQEKAVATYSNFKVGAIVTTKDRKRHLGFNIENSAYGCTICGERVALFSTYAKGYKKEDIASLSLITSSKNVGTPCGSCRQVMSELMDMNCPVYIYNCDESKCWNTTVKELLPGAFTSEDLKA